MAMQGTVESQPAAQSAAPSPVPASRSTDLAARMEKARQKAGYLPPSAYTDVRIVDKAKSAAAKAENRRLDYAAAPSSMEMKRRMDIARRAAGYNAGGTYSNNPVTKFLPPPVNMAITPELQRRMDKARKAAGYDVHSLPRKKSKTESPSPALAAQLDAPRITVTNGDATEFSSTNPPYGVEGVSFPVPSVEINTSEALPSAPSGTNELGELGVHSTIAQSIASSTAQAVSSLPEQDIGAYVMQVAQSVGPIPLAKREPTPPAAVLPGSGVTNSIPVIGVKIEPVCGDADYGASKPSFV